MIIATLSGVGQGSNTYALRDLMGSGQLPVQVEADPTVSAFTFRILGKVSPDMPWREIRAPASTGMLEAISFVPHLQLDVTSYTGSGNIRLAVSEG